MLLDGDALGQVARLVDVAVAVAGDAEGVALQRQDRENRLEQLVAGPAHTCPSRQPGAAGTVVGCDGSAPPSSPASEPGVRSTHRKHLP